MKKSKRRSFSKMFPGVPSNCGDPMPHGHSNISKNAVSSYTEEFHPRAAELVKKLRMSQ